MITVLAEQTFGNKAMRWLNKPKSQLDGATSVQTATTEAGVVKVEEMLVRIDEGMAS